MHRIVVVALPGVYPFELGVPSRFFLAARREGRPLYSVEVCSLDGHPVSTNAGFAIVPSADGRALDDAGTIVIPPWEGAETGDDPIGLDRFSDRRILSYCTGAFTVAASGLLDGKDATTHWCAADRFARRFPRIGMRSDELFVDNGSVITAAGASASIDATLHVIASDHGAAIAATTSQQTLAAPHRGGGQRQFIARPVAAPASAGGAGAIQEWLTARIDEPLSLAEVANEFGMSVRTLTRRFRAETGRTLGDWFADARVDRARQLLETTGLGIDAIATHSGFATAAALRKHFRDRLGLSPQQYRIRFTQTERNAA